MKAEGAGIPRAIFYSKSPAVRLPDVRARTHIRAAIARASL